MTTILLILIFISVFFNFVTFLMYCYEEANATARPIKHYILISCKTIIASILSEIAIMVLFPFGLFPMIQKETGPKKRPLVVLVHGLFHNPSAWLYFRFLFHRQQYATICLTYSSWNVTFNSTHAKIQNDLQHIVQTNPNRTIHLVGHSMGGLFLRGVVSKISGNNIVSISTLGTPFHGSKLSVFTASSLGQFLAFNGPTVREINNLDFPKHIKGQCLYSPSDNLVLPNSALRCEIDSWKEKAMQPMSHIAMLFNWKVFHEIQLFIESAN